MQYTISEEQWELVIQMLKWLRNGDNYLDPEFDPCEYADTAFDIMRNLTKN